MHVFPMRLVRLHCRVRACVLLLIGRCLICHFVFVADIGSGSCNGDNACAITVPTLLSVSISIGDGSCNFQGACLGNSGNVTQGACNAQVACYNNTGNVGEGGCSGLMACLNNRGNIGDQAACGSNEKSDADVTDPDAYRGACVNNAGSIGDNGCFDQGACADNENNIGIGSCKGIDSCLENLGTIGDQSWWVLVRVCCFVCISMLCVLTNVTHFWDSIRQCFSIGDEACCRNNAKITDGSCIDSTENCSNCGQP